MASKRITELTSLTAEALVTGDYLHIIDNSAAVSGKNKKITVQALLSGAGGSEPLPYKHKETFESSAGTYAAELTPHIWVAPPDRGFSNVARIRAWGGGGGGGGGNNLGNSGGGGGGGAYAETLFTYTPGRSYTVYVGRSGNPGAAGAANDNGTGGGEASSSYVCDVSAASTDTSTIPTSAMHILAAGARGGSGAEGSSGGGSAGVGGRGPLSVGDTTLDGAAGSSHNSDGLLGGSGGGSYRGGRGGRGGSTVDGRDNRPGSSPGAGGGGGAPHSGTAAKGDGARGAPGLVVIEYASDPAHYTSTVHSS